MNAYTINRYAFLVIFPKKKINRYGFLDVYGSPPGLPGTFFVIGKISEFWSKIKILVKNRTIAKKSKIQSKRLTEKSKWWSKIWPPI